MVWGLGRGVGGGGGVGRLREGGGEGSCGWVCFEPGKELCYGVQGGVKAGLDRDCASDPEQPFFT